MSVAPEIHAVIADDNVDAREALALLLPFFGVSRVTTTRDADETFIAIVDTEPDLVIIELAMVASPFYQRQLRTARAAAPWTIFVGYTSWTTDEIRAIASDTGMERLIIKSEPPEVFKSVVATAIERRELRRLQEVNAEECKLFRVKPHSPDDDGPGQGEL